MKTGLVGVSGTGDVLQTGLFMGTLCSHFGGNCLRAHPWARQGMATAKEQMTNTQQCSATSYLQKQEPKQKLRPTRKPAAASSQKEAKRQGDHLPGPQSLCHRVKLAGEKKDKAFSWKMDGAKQAWGRVRQHVLSVAV